MIFGSARDGDVRHLYTPKDDLERATEELSHMLEASDSAIDRVAVTNRFTAALKMLRAVEERDVNDDVFIASVAGLGGGAGGGGGGDR